MEKEDQLLKELIKENIETNGPPMDFTANIMRSIEAKKALRAKPIIGKFGWLIIAALFIGFVSVGLSQETNFKPFSYELSSLFDSLFDPSIFESLTLPILGLIAVASLIILDEVYRKRRKVMLKK